jgi:FdhD protein
LAIENRSIKLINIKPKPEILIVNEELALDEPTCIFVNGDYYATLIATPSQKKELSIGYIFTEGLINSINDIKSISLREKDIFIDLNNEVNLREASVSVMNLILTACDSKPRNKTTIKIPKIEYNMILDVDKIIKMNVDLNHRSKIHRRTGGTHAAMIYNKEGDLQAFAEDVGRHNAVDKVIGSMLIEKKDLQKSILISTGRLSAEIIYKAGRAQISIIVSRTVPLISGIRLAEVMGQTLVSLRNGQVKIYSNSQRIQLG